MFAIPSTITGVNIAALSSAVFTVVAAQAPESNAVRGLLTALTSGTAANVRYHAVSDPFDFTVWAPKAPRSLPAQNPVTGIRPAIPSNNHSIVLRKGLKPASDVAAIPSMFKFSMDIPAGAESYDPVQIAAALSSMAGLLNAKAASLYDNALTGSN
jgi:hypothetical protein